MVKKIFSIIVLLAVCVSLAAGCAHPQTAPAADKTESETAGAAEACDALFYGDSITNGGNFDELFPALRIVNLGINGATIEQLTEWAQQVSDRSPKKIFVMAGGNNLYYANVDECVELFRGLLDALQAACPGAEIFVESMLPMDKQIASKAECPNSVIKKFNEGLAALAEEYGLTYLDIYPAYEVRGGLNPDLTSDGVHLNGDAFGPWAEIVRPYLEP